MQKAENPSLSYCHRTGEERKTPLAEDGKFVNEEFPFGPSFTDFRRWKKEVNPYAKEKKESQWKLTPVQDLSWQENTADFIQWIGHATFLIRLNGIYLITDPLFGNATPFYPRQSALPFPKEALPPIDIILLSHNHRDHMSKSSLRFLKKANPNVQILTGLNMESLLKGVFKKNQIQCAGWYQRYHHPSINISFLPSRHWSKRGMFDFNDQLWGAFIIEANGKSIYFSGDTGYGNHLSEAGHWFHPDYVIMGIGAYQPEWFMESNHISPKNAIRAFQEMKGKWMIPMHYGCFDLSNESLEDPIRVYKEHRMIQENPSSFLAPVPGEIIYLQSK